MKIPNKLPIEGKISGSQLKRAFNTLRDAVMSNRVRGDQKTIKVNTTPAGTSVSAIRQPGGIGSGGGSSVTWAKVTAVTDANNYTVSIYNRSDESTALATSKQCRVFDIVDELAVNDWIPVQTSSVTDEDYESTQQLGAVG